MLLGLNIWGGSNTNRDFNTNHDQREKLVSFFCIELENRIAEHFLSINRIADNFYSQKGGYWKKLIFLND
jgi:hypothetical protein